MSEEITIDMKKIKKLKRQIPLLVLLLILAVSLWGTWFLNGAHETPGRTYNADFPSIGYHNMKENEYLSQAINMPRHGDYLRRIMHIFGTDEGPGYFEEYPQMPLLPWLFLVSWTLFGKSFWAARLVIIAFSLGSVIFTYLLTKRLTKNNEYLALTSALLMAIMPLGVFFGRNVQPEMPALFSILMGLYFFIKWFDTEQKKDLIWGAIGITLGASFKQTFLIVLIPLVAVFPWKKLKSDLRNHAKRKKWLQRTGLILLIVSPFIIWNFVISGFLNTKQSVLSGTLYRVSLFKIFTSTYWNEAWPAIGPYIRDNYAVWFFWLAIIGALLLLIKHKSRPTHFIWAYIIAIIPYSMVLADYIKGHSYYQMPFLPLIVIASAYTIYTIANIGKQAITQQKRERTIQTGLIFLVIVAIMYSFLKRKVLLEYGQPTTQLFPETVKIVLLATLIVIIGHAVYKKMESVEAKKIVTGSIVTIIILSTIFITLPEVKRFTNVQYGTIFYGLDVAGEYINTHSDAKTRFFFEGHSQSLGICYNADRRCGAAMNLTDMKFYERERNMDWYFLHGILGLQNLKNKDNGAMFDYVQKNYQLVHIGFIPQQEGWIPHTLVLRKGGTSDLVEMQNNEVMDQQPRLARTYNTPQGEIPYYVLEVE